MARIVYSKQGNRLVKKYRCTSGKRKGRLVSSPQACFGPIDIKKKMRMRQMRKQKSKSIAMKTKRTKATNPVSKQVARLNKLISK